MRTIIGAFYIILESNFLTHTYFKSLPPLPPLLYDKAAVKIKLAKAVFFVVIAPFATKGGGFPFNDTSA
ncbi:hypothetical protein Q644_08390 [Brucella intermedia 229E]|uniref:Uncharacterized protein n=1 Tax=Brucella intermedia 229E TaxID=1337887 RepID=U4V4B4_9HYPH|nr:hypothetical protein Q644_08390 [Brucella intermedia 229E]